MRKNLPITGKEVLFDDNERIISITNAKGVITAVNEAFIKISGFTEDELIGQAHNLVRHPDMPQAAFADLWTTLKQGKPWMGLVKNRCKNGDHYWVNAYVMPVYKNGQLTGYQSVRTKPERKHIETAERFYSNLQNNKKPFSFNNTKSRQYLACLLTASVPAMFIAAFNSNSWVALTSGAAAAVACSLALYKWQQKPLQTIQQRAKEIHDSDVACLAYCGNTSPLSNTEVALKSLQSQQATLVELLKNSAADLLSVIQETNDVVQKSNDGVNQQSTEITQLATAINQMSTAIDDVAKNAVTTASSTHEASIEVDDSQSIIENTKTAISQLAEDIGNANALIRDLKQDADNINNIVSVINGITFQTNLLALNASVEAARAGEAGKGFSVVAEEVRSLANSTQSSTTEIESTIQALQKRTLETVSVMEASQSQAKRTSEEAQSITSALETIAKSVASVSDMNTEIATATEQQSAVTKEINRSIGNINSSVDNITQAAQQTAEAGHKLEAVAEEINSVVAQFRR